MLIYCTLSQSAADGAFVLHYDHAPLASCSPPPPGGRAGPIFIHELVLLPEPFHAQNIWVILPAGDHKAPRSSRGHAWGPSLRRFLTRLVCCGVC